MATAPGAKSSTCASFTPNFHCNKDSEAAEKAKHGMFICFQTNDGAFTDSHKSKFRQIIS
jgi:hypothetical protein